MSEQEIKDVIEQIFQMTTIDDENDSLKYQQLMSNLDNAYRNYVAVYESEFFYEKLRRTYEQFSREDKDYFLRLLQNTPGFINTRTIFFNEEAYWNRFAIFDKLNDPDKYQKCHINMMAGVLHFDLSNDEMSRLNLLAELYVKRPNDEFWKNYLKKVRENDYQKFQVSAEELLQVLEEHHIDSKLFINQALTCLNDHALQEYSATSIMDNPELLGSLTIQQAQLVLSQIESEEDKAYLLLHTKMSTDTLALFTDFIEDDFVCRVLMNSKIDDTLDDLKNGYITYDDLMESIIEYLDVKQRVLEKPIEERTDFIISEMSNFDIYKPSLLKYIDSKDRMRVIQSMDVVVHDEELKDYEQLSRNMICEYFEDNCHLTPEEQEKLVLALKEFRLDFTTYYKDSINGECKSTSRTITLAEKNRGNIPQLLMDLVHERIHSFSLYDYPRTAYQCDKVFEEGMADTLAEQIVNAYFKKHPTVMINDEEFTPSYTLTSQSGYLNENGWVKTMLYPLEQTGRNAEAMKEYVLGDKKKFFNICVYDGFSETCEKDARGNIKNINVTEDELIEHHMEAYAKLNYGSSYMVRNNRIVSLSKRAKNLTKLRESQEVSPFTEIREAIESQDIRFGEVAASKFQMEQDMKHNKDKGGESYGE